MSCFQCFVFSWLGIGNSSFSANQRPCVLRAQIKFEEARNLRAEPRELDGQNPNFYSHTNDTSTWLQVCHGCYILTYKDALASLGSRFGLNWHRKLFLRGTLIVQTSLHLEATVRSRFMLLSASFSKTNNFSVVGGWIFEGCCCLSCCVSLLVGM